MAVRILVDSTSDIEPQRAASAGIAVVPLTVSFGDTTYRDGLDLDNAAFYRKLTESAVLPQTSTPSLGAFQEAYRRLIGEGATGIVSIHVSGSLSGTLNTATLAAQSLRDESSIPIRLVDSRTVSAGIGLPAIQVAQRAAAGAGLDELTALATELTTTSTCFFLLDTLEYLQKGGRIGKAQAMMGTMLNIKPILAIKDGLIVPLERVRTRSKALARIGELVREMGQTRALALAASDDAVAEEMRAEVRKVTTSDLMEFKLGAVIGTHAGPHAAGLFVFPQRA